MNRISAQTSYEPENRTDPESEGYDAESAVQSGSSTRLLSERLDSQREDCLPSTEPVLPQAPEVRSLRTCSTLIRDGSSIESSSSLPAQPRGSFDERKAGMALKQRLKMLHESTSRVVSGSQSLARQGWEWIWVSQGNRIERESVDPQKPQEQKLISKKLVRPSSAQKTNSVHRTHIQDNSSSSHGEQIAMISTSDAPSMEKTSTTSGLFRYGRSSSGASQISSKILRGFQYMYPHFKSPTGELEGLYCKTKRGIEHGLIGRRKADISSLDLLSFEDLPSRTTATLEGATSALGGEQLGGGVNHEPWSQTDVRTSTGASHRTDRSIGLAPWHRRNSQDSAWSITSSIRELLRGKTPAATPSSEMQYGGHKGKIYAKVDITKQDDPNFLPSEARLVATPLSTPSADPTRGFYFEPRTSAPDEEPGILTGDQATTSLQMPRKNRNAQSGGQTKHELWDGDEVVDTAIIRAQIGAVAK